MRKNDGHNTGEQLAGAPALTDEEYFLKHGADPHTEKCEIDLALEERKRGQTSAKEPVGGRLRKLGVALREFRHAMSYDAFSNWQKEPIGATNEERTERGDT